MVNLDNCACFAIARAWIGAADFARCSMDAKAKQTIPGAALPSLHHRNRHRSFYFTARCFQFCNRIISVEFGHGGENWNDEFTAGIRQGFIVKACTEASLFGCDRKIAILNRPVI